MSNFVALAVLRRQADYYVLDCGTDLPRCQT